MIIALDTLYENPFRPSGATEYYIDISKGLESIITSNDKLIILASRKNEHLFQFHRENVIKIIFKYSNENKFMRILTQQLIIPFIVLKYKIDVFQSGTVCPIFLPCKLVVFMHTLHAYTNPYSLPFLKRIYRRIFGRVTILKANAIIANSESTKKDILKYFNIEEKKIIVIHESVDSKVFSTRSKKSQNLVINSNIINRPFILFLSSLYKYKNIENILISFSKIQKDINKYRLVIAGSTEDKKYLNSIVDLAKKLNILDKTMFIGKVSLIEASLLYQNADLFICVTYYETFGKIFLEAMICGCPVIASNISSIPEVTGEAASLVDPDNINQIVSEILSILKNEEKRAMMIKKGFEQAAKFSISEQTKKTYKTYQSVFNF